MTLLRGCFVVAAITSCGPPTAPVAAVDAPLGAQREGLVSDRRARYRGFTIEGRPFVMGGCAEAVPLTATSTGFLQNGRRYVYDGKLREIPAGGHWEGVQPVPRAFGGGFLFRPKRFGCSAGGLQWGDFAYAPTFEAPLAATRGGPFNEGPGTTRYVVGPGFVFLSAASGGEGSFVELTTGRPIAGPAAHVRSFACATTGEMLAVTTDGALLWWRDPKAAPKTVTAPVASPINVDSFGTELSVSWNETVGRTTSEKRLGFRGGAFEPYDEAAVRGRQVTSGSANLTSDIVERGVALDDTHVLGARGNEIVEVDVSTGNIVRRGPVSGGPPSAPPTLRVAAGQLFAIVPRKNERELFTVDARSLAMKSVSRWDADALVTTTPHGLVVHGTPLGGKKGAARAFAHGQWTELSFEESTRSGSFLWTWYATQEGFVGASVRGSELVLTSFPEESGRRRVIPATQLGKQMIRRTLASMMPPGYQGLDFGDPEMAKRAAQRPGWSSDIAVTPSGALRVFDPISQGTACELAVEAEPKCTTARGTLLGFRDALLEIEPGGELRESLDFGQTWTRTPAPPTMVSAIVLARQPAPCSAVGCLFDGWVRVGWGADVDGKPRAPD